METISEDFVSSETAKLLKEKGFDQNCATYYLDGQVWRHYHGEVIPKGKQIYAAPTQAMAIKWLREVHNLFVFPFPQGNTNKFWAEIYQLSNNQEWENLYCESIDLQDYPTYEQACEAAIKYCLENLI